MKLQLRKIQTDTLSELFLVSDRDTRANKYYMSSSPGSKKLILSVDTPMEPWGKSSANREPTSKEYKMNTLAPLKST